MINLHIVDEKTDKQIWAGRLPGIPRANELIGIEGVLWIVQRVYYVAGKDEVAIEVLPYK